jgi:hypothetical protein
VLFWYLAGHRASRMQGLGTFWGVAGIATYVEVG